MNRRYAHQAGNSWRKWGDPLIYGRIEPANLWRGRVFLFWLVCIDLGALAALVLKVTR